MPKFRMREIVDAVQFIDSDRPLPAGVERGHEARWAGSMSDQSFFRHKYGSIYNYFVETPLGRIQVRPGDWIVTDSEGKRTAFTNEVFTKIFEPVEGVAQKG